MRLTVTETGKDRPGLPLVLLHAFPFDSRMWHGQLTGLSETTRVVAPDMRGFGQPLNNLLALETVRTTPPSMADYATDTLETLDSLAIPRAIVAGCSMGGYIAFELWRQAPHRIAGLILCDTRAEPDTDESRANRARQSERVAAEGVQFMADNAVQNLLGPASRDTLAEFTGRVVMTQSPVAVRGALAALAGRPDSRPTLPTITVPTLILVGEEDTVTPPPLSDSMHAAIPGSRLVRVAKAGHLAPLEQPDHVNQAIRQLLSEINET